MASSSSSASSTLGERSQDKRVRVAEIDANEGVETAIRPVTASQTVKELKEAIAEEIGAECDELSILFAETFLKDGEAPIPLLKH
jgi:hypothetical protein